jgi:hypothetical protein
MRHSAAVTSPSLTRGVPRPSPLAGLARAGHRTHSTLAACPHRCAGRRPCTLAAGRPHSWHICDNPNCPCHEAQP